MFLLSNLVYAQQYKLTKLKIPNAQAKRWTQPQTDEIHLITAIQCCHQAKRDKAVSTYMESIDSYNLPFFFVNLSKHRLPFHWNVLRPYLLKNLLLIFMCESGSNYSLCSASTLIIQILGMSSPVPRYILGQLGPGTTCRGGGS